MPNVIKSAVLILALQRRRKMTQYYRNIIIDQRTSWTKDQAVALLLGRRSRDPIYQDQNPDADPEEVNEQFMEWLDISIFSELIEERDGLLMELDHALEGKNAGEITACRERIVQCDDTIRRAKLILCDIDDELAKGAGSGLRKDQVATDKSGQVHVTLSSLKEWSSGRDYLSAPMDAPSTLDAPPARPSTEVDEPLLNSKGGMFPKSTRSFLVTFAVLLEQFVEKTGKQYVSESGTGINEQKIIELLSEKSLRGARKGHFLDDQSIASIKSRITKVIEASSGAIIKARAKVPKSK